MSVAFGPEHLRLLEIFESAIAARVPQGEELPFRVFARRRLWIKDLPLGAEPRPDAPVNVVPFVMRPIQKRYLAMKRAALRAGRRPRFLLLKYRRGGFTTIEQGISYRLAATRRNVNVVSLADIEERTAQIFRSATMMYEYDPSAPERKGVGNAYRIEFPALNSLFFIGKAAGRAFGRGDTLQRVHGSEVSRWCLGPNQPDRQKEILDGLDEAASHGEVVLETTPNGIEHFNRLYAAAKRGENDWTPIFIPWFADRSNTDPLEDGEAEQIAKNLDEREAWLVETHGLSPGQIKWRRRAVRRLGASFGQEYPEDDESCFLRGGNCYFDKERVLNILERTPDYQRQKVPGVSYRELRGAGSMNYEVVWEPPGQGEDYCIGVDTSEGRADSHPNGVGVVNYRTGAQAALVYGRFEPKALAEHAQRLARLYNDAFVGIERNNHGHAVLLALQMMGGVARLYWCGPEKSGWETDAVTRPVMLSELADAVSPPVDDQGQRAGGMEIRDREFLAQCLSFRRQHNGQYERDPGADDDAIFIWAIAWQMRKHFRPGRGARAV